MRVCVLPTLRVTGPERATPVTGIELALTVTMLVAVLPPSAVVAVIMVVPAETAVITPSVDTVATLILLLLQLTFRFVALEGLIIAVKVSVPPTKMLVDVFTVTPVTATVLPELLP